jgi:branched-chain amino acid transport system substrate-binding protein
VVINPSDDAYAVSTAQIATQAFTSEGVQVLAPVTFPAATTTLSQSVATAVGESPGALMVVASSGTIAATVIKDARADGFTGRILGSNTLNSQATLQAAGSAGDGAQSAAGWYLGNDSSVNQEFVTDYVASAHRSPDQFAAQAYTGVELLAQAARHSALTFSDTAADRSAIRTSLAAVHMETPLGSFSFTADHDVEQPVWVVAIDGDHYRLVAELPAP